GWSIVVLLALGAAALITGWFIRLAALRRSSTSSNPHNAPLEAAGGSGQCVEGESQHGHTDGEDASLLPASCVRCESSTSCDCRSCAGSSSSSSVAEWSCGVERASKSRHKSSVWRRVFRWCARQVAVVLRVLQALLSTFHVPSLLLGALAALLGGSSFLVEVPTTYWIWHSVWHVCMYSAAFFFILASPPPKKHGALPLALSPHAPPPKEHDSFRSGSRSNSVGRSGSTSGEGNSEGGWSQGKRATGCSVGREVEVDEERGLLLIREHS
ncbi:unnamed protein product, partial [Closterium sp. NIES-53]